MQDFLKALTGARILEKASSDINGEIVVQTDLAWGPHILVDGLSQSGGVVKQVWQKLFKKIKNNDPKNILILGLGGGTIAKMSSKKWPKAKIVGVEIDPEMVRLGQKYLGLMNIHLEKHIGDAYKFLLNNKQKYDLILIDVYTGRNVPEKFTTEKFVTLVDKHLSTKGIAVFNRLYGPDNRSKAVKFLKVLEKKFVQVDAIYPVANVMYICTN